MRHSVAPNRVSQAGPYPSSSAATVAKLLEKKKEFDAVSALEKASALYLERIEVLGEDCIVMANAGEVHGQVLAQWPKMFNILSQFLASRECINAEHGDGVQQRDVEGERLVRIPIEELAPQNTDNEQP